MLKVAVLDDYQSAFVEIVDIEKLKNKFDFKIFNEAFNDENEAIEALEEFEALFIMRERTPITKSLLENLPNLKYIMTSGMRNNSINLEVTKRKGILRLAWSESAPISGAVRNTKAIDAALAYP